MGVSKRVWLRLANAARVSMDYVPRDTVNAVSPAIFTVKD